MSALGHYPPRSDCVLYIQSAKAPSRRINTEGCSGGLYQHTAAIAMIYTSARVCVCLHVHSAPCVTCHLSLSLEELPCIAEHQPYAKLASGGDVGQAGNDASFKCGGGGGGLPDNGRPLHWSQGSDGVIKMVREKKHVGIWVTWNHPLHGAPVRPNYRTQDARSEGGNIISSLLGCQICLCLNYRTHCKSVVTPHLLPVLR